MTHKMDANALPLADAREIADNGNHTAHFYETDGALIKEIGQRMAAGLSRGGAAVVIATPPHCEALEKLLATAGIDLQELAAEGRWTALDADETLSSFLVEGWPDAKRFHALMEDLLDRLTPSGAAAPRFTIYGEMVSLLWERGKLGAAIHLEELWNELGHNREFHLSCGWPLRFFSRDPDGSAIESICSQHTHIVPAQGYEAMSENDRRRSSVLWQLKARALEAEVRENLRIRQVLETRQAELRDFMENAVIGIQWIGPNGMILWANRTVLSLLGYESEQYVGHSLSEFIVDPPCGEKFLQDLRNQEDLRGFQLRLRCGDGSPRWFRIDANPRLKDGQFLHARCFVLDVTEQKLADEAQMKLAAIVESSDDAIASKDLTGIVTSWNAAAERILGYKAEEILGKPITMIIPPELHKDEPEILRKIQAGERIAHFETVRVTKGGERLDVSLTVSPVRDRQGNVVGAAKILRDVTVQKRLESALRTTERLASVGRLAATVAHEINNPLEAITNLIYIARQDPGLPESALACLVAADAELQRVSHIARQTLGFYRDTSNPVWIAVSESVDEILAIYERRFRYKSMSVRKDIQAGLRICALHGEFKQILSNLISNAIDASLPGCPVEIRAWQSCHPVTRIPGIRMTIVDHGTGIVPENLRKIFAPFFTTKKDVGTGLGLWIVKDLLEKKGGSIRCRSRVASSSLYDRSGTMMMIFVPIETRESEKAGDPGDRRLS